MSENEDTPRRSTYVEHEVVYAAVGASAHADLMRFPPDGTTPFEHSLKLGSGSDRFVTASNILMTWGAQRAAGVEVIDVRQAQDERYSGVVFSKDGTPEPPAALEVRYGADGEAFLTAGTTATLHWPQRKLSRHVRVMYVVDETRRAGFALGTADDAGVIGETAFIVEHREDDTVWAVTRGFYAAPTNGIFGLKAKAMHRLAEKSAIAQISVLVPGAAHGVTNEGE